MRRHGCSARKFYLEKHRLARRPYTTARMWVSWGQESCFVHYGIPVARRVSGPKYTVNKYVLTKQIVLVWSRKLYSSSTPSSDNNMLFKKNEPRPAVPCPLGSYHTMKDGPTITVCPSPAVTISHIKCLRSQLGLGRSLVRHRLLRSTPGSCDSGSPGWGPSFCRPIKLPGDADNAGPEAL